MTKPVKYILKIAALAVGGYLLWAVLKDISWEDLKELFISSGPLLLIPLLVYPAACIFHALALRALLTEEEKKNASLWDIYIVRMAGDSINKMTPFIDIGGEPLKMALLAKHRLLSLQRSVITVWLSRVAFVSSEIPFILLGWLVLAVCYPGFELTWVIWTGLIISTVYLGLLISAQLHGLVKVIPTLARYMKLDTKDEVWEKTDQGLKSFYKEYWAKFIEANFYQFIGWAAGLVEVYLIFIILGFEISLTQAFIIQAILEVIKTASFLIPANLGAQETGLAALSAHLGYTATDGLALSLLKRFRHIFWVVGGLVIWKLFEPRLKRVRNLN